MSTRMTLLLKSSPHGHNQKQTAHIMREVAWCMLPGIAMQWLWFGPGVIIQIVLALVSAWITEALILIIRKRPIFPTLRDNSALVTALLLAVALPPIAPWWLVVLGSMAAIAVAKQLYGGLGQNIFNPAMVGYVILLISFPAFMIQWPVPVTLQADPLTLTQTLQLIFSTRDAPLLTQATQLLDGSSGATVLDYFKTQKSSGYINAEITQSPLFKNSVGVGWFWVNIGYLLGGCLLLYRRIIRWHIPISILLSLSLGVMIGFLVSPSTQAGLLLNLFSGATMLGAFFIATDPVSCAVSTRGKLIYGALIGGLTYLIRTYGNYPDAIAFAVLLANTAVPLIDLYFRPTVYGDNALHDKDS